MSSASLYDASLSLALSLSSLSLACSHMYVTHRHVITAWASTDTVLACIRAPTHLLTFAPTSLIRMLTESWLLVRPDELLWFAHWCVVCVGSYFKYLYRLMARLLSPAFTEPEVKIRVIKLHEDRIIREVLFLSPQAISLSVRLSVSLSVSVCLPVCLSVSLSVSVCLPLCLSACVCLSVCGSVCLSCWCILCVRVLVRSFATSCTHGSVFCRECARL